VLKHSFGGTAFTVGVEEELMIVDAESKDLAHGIEQILEALPEDAGVRVKPELMQSVLEVATEPCPDVETAGNQLAALRAKVSGATAPTASRSARREPTPSPAGTSSGSSSAPATRSWPGSSATWPTGR
jgi:hypothetical protein